MNIPRLSPTQKTALRQLYENAKEDRSFSYWDIRNNFITQPTMNVLKRLGLVAAQGAKLTEKGLEVGKVLREEYLDSRKR